MPARKDARLLDLLADELDALRGELERLGVALCADPAVARGHMAALQSLDQIGQRQAAIAEILRAPDRAKAARDVRLEAMARRLAVP